MRRIVPAIQPYAWGSHTFLAELQGRTAPTVEPEAELWVGAHPSAPAALCDGRRLDAAIAAEPVAALGERSVRRFGPHLPYLLKVLAAERPLSLQAHPDRATAQAAYAHRHPSYVDGNHKPELLVALTEFDALCGFRPPKESADYLASLAVEPLDDVVDALTAGDLKTAVQTIYGWSDAERQEVVPWIAAAAAEQGGHAAGARDADTAGVRDADPAGDRDGGVAATLAAHYPGDVGIVVALLLNHVTLQPGEAIWMPAGNLHAYLRGAGVEIMAASDNVLRGGLTRKRVDVPELLRVLSFTPLADPVRHPVTEADGVQTWPVPVDDFVLWRMTVDGTVQIGPSGGRTALCVSGSVTVADSEAGVDLGPGEAAFGNAGAGQLRLTGAGVVFLASSQ